jgi:hypothetical protein
MMNLELRAAGLAGLGEGDVQALQHVFRRVDVAVETIPARTVPNRTAQRGIGVTTDDDRNMRLLNGLRVHPHCFELHPFAFEIDDVFDPQAAHDLHELIAAGAAILPSVGTGFDFLLVPANTNAEVDPPLGQPIERAHLFRGVDRVPLRHESDARAKPELAGHRRQKSEGRRDIQHPPTGGHRNATVLGTGITERVLVEQRDMLAHPD